MSHHREGDSPEHITSPSVSPDGSSASQSRRTSESGEADSICRPMRSGTQNPAAAESSSSSPASKRRHSSSIAAATEEDDRRRDDHADSYSSSLTPSSSSNTTRSSSIASSSNNSASPPAAGAAAHRKPDPKSATLKPGRNAAASTTTTTTTTASTATAAAGGRKRSSVVRASRAPDSKQSTRSGSNAAGSRAASRGKATTAASTFGRAARDTNVTIGLPGAADQKKKQQQEQQKQGAAGKKKDGAAAGTTTTAAAAGARVTALTQHEITRALVRLQDVAVLDKSEIALEADTELQRMWFAHARIFEAKMRRAERQRDRDRTQAQTHRVVLDKKFSSLEEVDEPAARDAIFRLERQHVEGLLRQLERDLKDDVELMAHQEQLKEKFWLRTLALIVKREQADRKAVLFQEAHVRATQVAQQFERAVSRHLLAAKREAVEVAKRNQVKKVQEWEKSYRSTRQKHASSLRPVQQQQPQSAANKPAADSVAVTAAPSSSSYAAALSSPAWSSPGAAGASTATVAFFDTTPSLPPVNGARRPTLVHDEDATKQPPQKQDRKKSTSSSRTRSSRASSSSSSSQFSDHDGGNLLSMESGGDDDDDSNSGEPTPQKPRKNQTATTTAAAAGKKAGTQDSAANAAGAKKSTTSGAAAAAAASKTRKSAATATTAAAAAKTTNRRSPSSGAGGSPRSVDKSNKNNGGAASGDNDGGDGFVHPVLHGPPTTATGRMQFFTAAELDKIRQRLDALEKSRRDELEHDEASARASLSGALSHGLILLVERLEEDALRAVERSRHALQRHLGDVQEKEKELRSRVETEAAAAWTFLLRKQERQVQLEWRKFEENTVRHMAHEKRLMERQRRLDARRAAALGTVLQGVGAGGSGGLSSRGGGQRQSFSLGADDKHMFDKQPPPQQQRQHVFVVNELSTMDVIPTLAVFDGGALAALKPKPPTAPAAPGAASGSPTAAGAAAAATARDGGGSSNNNRLSSAPRGGFDTVSVVSTSTSARLPVKPDFNLSPATSLPPAVARVTGIAGGSLIYHTPRNLPGMNNGPRSLASTMQSADGRFSVLSGAASSTAGGGQATLFPTMANARMAVQIRTLHSLERERRLAIERDERLEWLAVSTELSRESGEYPEFIEDKLMRAKLNRALAEDAKDQHWQRLAHEDDRRGKFMHIFLEQERALAARVRDVEAEEKQVRLGEISEWRGFVQICTMHQQELVRLNRMGFALQEEEAHWRKQVVAVEEQRARRSVMTIIESVLQSHRGLTAHHSKMATIAARVERIQQREHERKEAEAKRAHDEFVSTLQRQQRATDASAAKSKKHATTQRLLLMAEEKNNERRLAREEEEAMAAARRAKRAADAKERRAREEHEHRLLHPAPPKFNNRGDATQRQYPDPAAAILAKRAAAAASRQSGGRHSSNKNKNGRASAATDYSSEYEEFEEVEEVSVYEEEEEEEEEGAARRPHEKQTRKVSMPFAPDYDDKDGRFTKKHSIASSSGSGNKADGDRKSSNQSNTSQPEPVDVDDMDL